MSSRYRSHAIAGIHETIAAILLDRDRNLLVGVVGIANLQNDRLRAGRDVRNDGVDLHDATDEIRCRTCVQDSGRLSRDGERDLFNGFALDGQVDCSLVDRRVPSA